MGARHGDDTPVIEANPRTRPVADDEAPVDARTAFVLAFDRLVALASASEEPAFVVAAVGPRGRLEGAARVAAGSALVVGRHTSCGLRLTREDVSLRHLTLLVTSDARGPECRVWDMQTEDGFTCGEVEQRAVVAEGPMHVGLGAYRLWVMPAALAASWQGEPLARAWASLPDAAPASARSEPVRAPRGVWPEPRPSLSDLEDDEDEGAPEAEDHAHFDRPPVTALAEPLLLAEDDDPEVPWARIRLESGPHKSTRGISAERLERGLLIGRHPRCGLVLANGDAELSRVHLMLVRIGADVWAIDTASQNGTTRNGERLVAAVLDDGDRLRLGKALEVRWTRVRLAEA